MGDSRGIGPEVIIHTLKDRSVRKLANFLVIGDLRCMDDTRKALKTRIPIHEIELWELINSKKVAFDKDAVNVLHLGAEDDGRDPLRYIDCAVTLIKNGRSSALVTAPVNKEDIMRSGVDFSGVEPKTEPFSPVFSWSAQSPAATSSASIDT